MNFGLSSLVSRTHHFRRQFHYVTMLQCNHLVILFLNTDTFWNNHLKVKIIQSIFCLNQKQFEIYVLITNYLNKYAG